MMAKHIEFVNNIPLAEPTTHFGDMAGDETDKKKQGFVDKGSLVSFTEKVTGQQKRDVLNSALFAQLAAEYKFNRETQTEDWYKCYGEVLEKVGWVMQGCSFQKYERYGGTFTMAAAVIDILEAIASGDEIAAAKKRCWLL